MSSVPRPTFAVVPGSTPVELVSGKVAAPKGVVVNRPWSRMRADLCVDTDVSLSTQMDWDDPAGAKLIGDNWSMLIMGHQDGTSNGGAFMGRGEGTTTNAEGEWQLVARSGDIKFDIYNASALQTRSLGVFPTVADADDYILVCTHSASGFSSWQIVNEGITAAERQLSTDTAITMPTTTSAAGVTLGNEGRNGDSRNLGPKYLALIWNNYTLSSGQVESLIKNPWQVFQSSYKLVPTSGPLGEVEVIDEATNELIGIATLQISATGELVAIGELVGSASMAFSGTGVITDGAPGGAGNIPVFLNPPRIIQN